MKSKIMEMFTMIGSAASAVALIYMMMLNFKADVNSHIDRIEKRQDLQDQRMFYLATGRTLADAMKDEKK